MIIEGSIRLEYIDENDNHIIVEIKGYNGTKRRNIVIELWKKRYGAKFYSSFIVICPLINEKMLHRN